MLQTRAAIATALLAGTLGSCAVAAAQSPAVASCSNKKVSLPAEVLDKTQGRSVPIVIEVHAADLSAMPGVKAATTAAQAKDAVQPIYRARVITVATLAGWNGTQVADMQGKLGLDASRSADTAWSYKGTMLLITDTAERACQLGALPEVDRVYSVPAVLPDPTEQPTTTR